MARKVEEIDRIDKFIGNKIHELRIALGLSRQQLSTQINVTHQQLQKYEKGTNRVSAGRLAVVANYMNKPVSYFYEGVTNNNENTDIIKYENQRMCIEVSRNFMKIKNIEYKDAVNVLIKSLANINE